MLRAHWSSHTPQVVTLARRMRARKFSSARCSHSGLSSICFGLFASASAALAL